MIENYEKAVEAYREQQSSSGMESASIQRRMENLETASVNVDDLSPLKLISFKNYLLEDYYGQDPLRELYRRILLRPKDAYLDRTMFAQESTMDDPTVKEMNDKLTGRDSMDEFMAELVEDIVDIFESRFGDVDSGETFELISRKHDGVIGTYDMTEAMQNGNEDPEDTEDPVWDTVKTKILALDDRGRSTLAIFLRKQLNYCNMELQKADDILGGDYDDNPELDKMRLRRKVLSGRIKNIEEKLELIAGLKGFNVTSGFGRLKINGDVFHSCLRALMLANIAANDATYRRRSTQEKHTEMRLPFQIGNYRLFLADMFRSRVRMEQRMYRDFKESPERSAYWAKFFETTEDGRIALNPETGSFYVKEEIAKKLRKPDLEKLRQLEEQYQEIFWMVYDWFIDTTNIIDFITKIQRQHLDLYKKQIEEIVEIEKALKAAELKGEIEDPENKARIMKLENIARLSSKSEPREIALSHYGRITEILDRGTSISVVGDRIAMGADNKREYEKRALEIFDLCAEQVFEEIRNQNAVYPFLKQREAILAIATQAVKYKEDDPSAKNQRLKMICMINIKRYILSDRNFLFHWKGLDEDSALVQEIEQRILTGCDPVTNEFKKDMARLADLGFETYWQGGDEFEAFAPMQEFTIMEEVEGISDQIKSRIFGVYYDMDLNDLAKSENGRFLIAKTLEIIWDKIDIWFEQCKEYEKLGRVPSNTMPVISFRDTLQTLLDDEMAVRLITSDK